MSPAIKLEDQPAVSLLLVKPATNDQVTLTPADSDDQISRAAMMQLLYKLMLLVGQNMSTIQQANAESQLNQAQLAKHQADVTQGATQQFMDKLNELSQEQADSKKWALFGEIMKWVGVAVAVLIGCLLIESGVGLAILAAAIAITTIPISNGKTIFDMASSGLASEIVKIPGIDKTWANIIAQVLLIVVLTVLSCGAEGVSVGISRAAASAAETAAAAGAQAATEAAEEVTEEVTEEASEEASSQASTATEKDANKTTLKDYMPVRTAATTEMFMQTLFTSGVMQELVMKIPGMDKHPELAALLTILLEIVMMVAAYKMTPSLGGGTSLLKQAETALGNATRIRLGIGSFVFTTQITTQVANGGQSYNMLQQGQANSEIAPIQAQLLFGEGFFQIMTQLTSLAQKIYNESMHANETIFKTDFSADMKACVAAQQYQG